MSVDPLSAVIDAPIDVTPEMLRALRTFRASDKFRTPHPYLFFTLSAAEEQRLTVLFDDALDGVIAGLAANPRKRWVLAQLQPSLEEMFDQDTEVREHFGVRVEQLLDIVGVASTEGMLSFYLGQM